MEVLISLKRSCAIRMRLILFVALSAACPFLWAATPISKEYQVKAIFLFNFAQFVQWPVHAFTGPDDALTICILGDDPFGSFLDDIVRNEKVDGHPMVIKRCNRVEDVEGCQILFVSSSERDHYQKILAALRGKSVLTVSDIDGFVRNGGMIRLMMEGGKIHFRINLGSTKKARLKISSKLLRLAEIAGTEGN